MTRAAARDPHSGGENAAKAPRGVQKLHAEARDNSPLSPNLAPPAGRYLGRVTHESIRGSTSTGLLGRLGKLLHRWSLELCPELAPVELPPPPPLLTQSSEAASEQATPDLAQLAERVSASMESARKEVLQRIQVVNETTERETLAAGESLQNIVAEARRQADDARAVLEQLGGGGNAMGVPAMAGRQSALVQAFLRQIDEDVAKHEATMAESQGLSERIVSTGKRVGGVAFQARLLSMNAAIEAARLGEAGAAFGIIAQEMTRLSGEVDLANRSIGELARELLRYLPLAQAQAASMRSTTAEFSARLASELGQLQAGSAEFERRVAQTLQRGDKRISKIAESSNDALSHLAFQDVCAQRLFSVDAVLARLCDVVVQRIAQPTEADPPAEFAKVQRNAAFCAGEVVALQADSEPGGDEAASAGEVLMF